MSRLRLPFFGLIFLLVIPPFLWSRNVSDIVGDTFEETAGSGFVIRTYPTGVKVFIDGAERGQTPYSNNSLRPGDYNIRLSKDGYRDRRFRITITGRSRLNISIEMEEILGQVLVRIKRADESPSDLPFQPVIDGGSSNEGRNVISAGDGEGETFILNLPVGLRTIRLRAFGWEDSVQTVYVRENFPSVVDASLKPAVFSLSGEAVNRRRFNPDNPGDLGKAEFRFEASAPGRARLSILDQNNTEVYSCILGPFDTWFQTVSWNGRDNFDRPLPEGLYRVFISGETVSDDSGDSGDIRTLALETQIDYSINIYPLALSGGIPGLLFAPVPAALVRGSFQIEVSLFFGSFSAPEKSPLSSPDRAFSTLPFEAALRFFPHGRLELAAAFNVNPAFGSDTGFGFYSSAKYLLVRGIGSFPLEMAAGISYTWAQSRGEAPLGTGRGGGLYLPLSVDAGPVRILFSPGMRWPGMDDPIPRLLLSAGALYRWRWLTAGLSARTELDFTNTGSRANVSFEQRMRTLCGAEIKIFPPPSSLIFSMAGGAWFKAGRAGPFGGLGLGFIH